MAALSTHPLLVQRLAESAVDLKRSKPLLFRTRKMDPNEVGRFFLLHCDETRHAAFLVDKLQTTFKQDGLSTILLGSDDAAIADVTSPARYFIQLFRRHRLHTNDRELVLSSEEQMVAMQLCLAEKNKKETGDFDVVVSHVVEVNARVISVRLSGQPLDSESDRQVATEYMQFLKGTMTTDLVDVVLRVMEESERNPELAKEINRTQFYVVSVSSDPVEHAMLRFLAEGKQVLSAHLEVSLDSSLSDNISQGAEVVWRSCDLEQDLQGRAMETHSSPISNRPKSVTECYVQQIFTSYLQLLVNIRNETALARVINVPDRCLDHRAFTAIKKEAKKTKLSMYQTASSYVMRLRLGGKSYAPDPKSALAPYVKGISEFTQLINKLQTIVEEEANTHAAVRRILNILRSTVTKSHDSCLRQDSVDVVTERLQARVAVMADNIGSIMGDSPKRDVSVGGSTCGRANMKLIRSLLDELAGEPFVGRTVDILGDTVSSQKTPVRFPSLLSKFRSPLEHSPGCPESKSLVERVKENTSKPKQKCVVKRYQACLDWAQTDDKFNQQDTKEASFVMAPQSCMSTASRPNASDNSQPSKTEQAPQKHQNTNKEHVPTDSMYDQENIDARQRSNKPKDASGKIPGATKRPLESVNCDEPSSQRTKITSLSTQQGKNATKTAKTTTKKTAKKKNAPLLKGQKQLTAFFRL